MRYGINPCRISEDVLYVDERQKLNALTKGRSIILTLNNKVSHVLTKLTIYSKYYTSDLNSF